MFKIGSNVISNKNKPFIIAEISANHKNNLSHLLKMIDSAAEVGASAVKIQTIPNNSGNKINTSTPPTNETFLNVDKFHYNNTTKLMSEQFKKLKY